MVHPRPFKEVHVANFHVQKRSDRYPDPDKKYKSTDDVHILSEEPRRNEGKEAYGEPPRIAQWRSNLVALSQDFNIYFAAYRDKIHCYVPRNLKQIIPATADLIIDLPQSPQGRKTGGYINRLYPHCVNHMKVGSLGNFEILLMACDDGDVLAFYTHQIRDELSITDPAARDFGRLRPFFHQNVGKSAWGLAIHKKSKLIAVSCNASTVTIFAPAYSVHESATEFIPRSETFPSHESLKDPPTSFEERELNFKLVVKFRAPLDDNIPTIDFHSDSDGRAMQVISGDIQGRIYIIDPFSCCIMADIPPTPDMQAPSMAWGVLALPLENFTLVETGDQGFGTSLGQPLNKMTRYTAEVSTIRFHQIEIPSQTSETSGAYASKIKASPQLVLEQDGDRNTSLVPSPQGQPVPQRFEDEHLQKERFRNEQKEKWTNETFQKFLSFPPTVRAEIEGMGDLEEVLRVIKKLGAQGITPVFPTINSSGSRLCSQQSFAVLRCSKWDIGLLSHFENPGQMTMMKFPPGGRVMYSPHPSLKHYHRINLVATIPELNLVAAGSQLGQVCLLTLTKMNAGDNHPVVMFCADHMLPFTDHEIYQPRCPLLGMAVSPLQTSDNHWDDENAWRSSLSKEEGEQLETFPWLASKRKVRRWRLILHFFDHTIMSYELGRSEETDALEVFEAENWA